MRQVHGADVWYAAADAAEPPGPVDAMFTDVPGKVLCVLVADCVPVLIADPAARLVGAAHAGREGLVAGVVPALVSGDDGGRRQPGQDARGDRPGDLRWLLRGARADAGEGQRDRAGREMRHIGGNGRARHRGRSPRAACRARVWPISLLTGGARGSRTSCTPTGATGSPAGSPGWSGCRRDGRAGRRGAPGGARGQPRGRPGEHRRGVRGGWPERDRGHAHRSDEDLPRVRHHAPSPARDRRHRREQGSGGSAQGRRVRSGRASPALALCRAAPGQQGRERGQLRGHGALGGSRPACRGAGPPGGQPPGARCAAWFRSTSRPALARSGAGGAAPSPVRYSIWPRRSPPLTASSWRASWPSRPLASPPGPPMPGSGRSPELVRAAHPAAQVISAGMSGDLGDAIAEGATHVRIGTALLGGRRAFVR